MSESVVERLRALRTQSDNWTQSKKFGKAALSVLFDALTHFKENEGFAYEFDGWVDGRDAFDFKLAGVAYRFSSRISGEEKAAKIVSEFRIETAFPGTEAEGFRDLNLIKVAPGPDGGLTFKPREASYPLTNENGRLLLLWLLGGANLAI